MTYQTMDLIKAFAKTLDLKLLPSIIVGMQEEDDVFNRIRYRNCFRMLRNICAHEPATLTSQLMVGDNANNSRTTLVSKDGKYIVFDAIQVTVWMFDMYMLTNNVAYIVFWQAYLKLLYPSIFENTVEDSDFVFSGDSQSVYKEYMRWQEFMTKTYGDVKKINITNPYITKILEENPRVFWRMAIPDMFDMVKFYVSGHVDTMNKTNISMFLKFYQVHEDQEA